MYYGFAAADVTSLLFIAFSIWAIENSISNIKWSQLFLFKKFCSFCFKVPNLRNVVLSYERGEFTERGECTERGRVYREVCRERRVYREREIVPREGEFTERGRVYRERESVPFNPNFILLWKSNSVIKEEFCNI